MGKIYLIGKTLTKNFCNFFIFLTYNQVFSNDRCIVYQRTQKIIILNYFSIKSHIRLTIDFCG